MTLQIHLLSLVVWALTLSGCGGSTASDPPGTPNDLYTASISSIIDAVPQTGPTTGSPGSLPVTIVAPPTVSTLPSFNYPTDFPVNVENIFIGSGVQVSGLDPLTSYTFSTDSGSGISAQNHGGDHPTVACFEQALQCTGTAHTGTLVVLVIGTNSSRFTLDIKPSDALPVYYEGTVDEPVTVTTGSRIGRVGPTRFINEFSFYQLQNLTIGNRYAVRMTSRDKESLKATMVVTDHDNSTLCDPNRSGSKACQFVATNTEAHMQIDGSRELFGAVFNITLEELSPAIQFEGSWLRPTVIPMIDPQMNQHLGYVDEYDSHYDITGLISGQRYTVNVHSHTNLSTLSTVTLESGLKAGGICKFENPWDNNGDTCTFTAIGSRQRISLSGSISNPTAVYILTIGREPPSQGTINQPINIPYGQVTSATVSSTESSYYELNGLPIGSDILLSVQFLSGELFSYSLSNSNGPIPCTGTGGCKFTANSEAALLTVIPKPDSIRSTRFVVAAMPLPANVTESISNSALPAPVQVSDYFSSYTINGLRPNTEYKVNINNPTNRTSLNVLSDGVIRCGSPNKLIPQPGCPGVTDSTGSFIVRLGGSSPGAWAILSVEQRVPLSAQYLSSATHTVVPDNYPPGVSSATRINDSGIAHVANIKVSVDLTHEYTSDLSLSLIAPDGRSVLLSDHLAGRSLLDTVFDDYAAHPIAENESRFNRVLRPQYPLHIMNGIAADGLWTLKVVDDRAANISTALGGVLRRWGLSFSPH